MKIFLKHDRQRMWRSVAAILIATLLFFPTSEIWAQTDGGETAVTEVVDRIVAVVNNDVILLSELDKAMIPYEEAIQQRGLAPEDARKMRYRTREKILNDLIESQLTEQKAEELGITVTGEDIDAAIEHMKQSMLYTDEELRQVIAEEGYTMAEYRRQIQSQILRSQLLSREVKSKTVVTREEIEAYYKAHYDHPEKEGMQYHLRNIVMRPPASASREEEQATLKVMQSIRQQIESGAPFEEMARQYSQSSFAADGGDLGLFALDTMSDRLREVIAELEAGEMSPVIETGQGYQIFYVQEIVDSADVSVDKFAEEIRRKIYKEKLNVRFEAWLTQLREQSHIKRIL